jgi:hypothetical protein
MAKRKVRVELGSGNVFTDLGYADAKERTLKVELAVEVNRLPAFPRAHAGGRRQAARHPAAARLRPRS